MNKVHDTFPIKDLENLKKQKRLADAREYEQPLDTLVEFLILAQASFELLRKNVLLPIRRKI